MNIFRKVFAALIAFLLMPSFSLAQVTLGGIADIEVKKGQRDSNPFTNEVQNANATFLISRLQLFVDADIGENIFFTSKIEANLHRTTSLNSFRVSLASVTFANLIGNHFNLEAGKILTPFGLYPKLQLSPDNFVIGTPLAYFYYVKVSKVRGYFPSDREISIIYPGAYYLGVNLFGTFFHGDVRYDAAIVNEPLSNGGNDINFNKEFAFMGRIAVRPFMWLTVGGSYSRGAFMDQHPINASLVENLEAYKQTTYGADFDLNYLYYELRGEYIYNKWRAPYIVNTSPTTYALQALDLSLQNYSFYVEGKINFPFIVGLYLAGRFEQIRFGEIVDPDNPSRIVRWDKNIQRVEAGVGYKLGRGIKLKVTYQINTTDVFPEPQDNVFAAQLSVKF